MVVGCTSTRAASAELLCGKVRSARAFLLPGVSRPGWRTQFSRPPHCCPARVRFFTRVVSCRTDLGLFCTTTGAEAAFATRVRRPRRDSGDRARGATQLQVQLGEPAVFPLPSRSVCAFLNVPSHAPEEHCAFLQFEDQSSEVGHNASSPWPDRQLAGFRSVGEGHQFELPPSDPVK